MPLSLIPAGDGRPRPALGRSVLVARDDRAGQAGASIAGRLRAVIVGHRMHDQALADDVGGAAAHADAAERELHVDAALRVGLQRRQVTGMAFGGVLRAMRLAGGVEVAPVLMPSPLLQSPFSWT